jgi:hypothetical protein
MSSDSTKQLVRNSLYEHAALARTDVDFVREAKAVARRRRRLRRTGLVSAIVVIGAVVPLAVVLKPGSERNEKPASTTVTDERPFKGVDTSDWRVESYRGVELSVPRFWSWGATPPSRTKPCGPFFDARTDAFRHAMFDVGYVGRPDAVAWWQVCRNPPVEPHTPYVWFDSPLSVGSEMVSSSATLVMRRTTVIVNGIRVTVADNNSGERAAILGTVRTVAVDSNGCPTGYVTSGRPLLARGADQPQAAFSKIGVAQGASVCLYGYQRLGSAAEPVLVASLQLTARVAHRAQLELASTPRLSKVPLAGCLGSKVVIRFRGEHRDALVETEPCSGYINTGEDTRRMTKANTAPWLVGAVRSWLKGNDPRGVISRFER